MKRTNPPRNADGADTCTKKWAIPCKQGHDPQKSNSFLNFLFIFKLLLIDVRTRM